ncbi:MAG: phosphohydrolase [Pseudomonadota bacterium]
MKDAEIDLEKKTDPYRAVLNGVQDDEIDDEIARITDRIAGDKMYLDAMVAEEARRHRQRGRDAWIMTASGGRFHPLDPKPDEVKLEDIAQALSNTCRYSGHCTEFYSVAEHCVHVSNFVPPQYAAWGLLHDAGEAYLADIARPVKPFLPGFAAIEKKIMAAVCTHFGLPLQEPTEVKRVDTAILVDEAQQLMDGDISGWHLPEPPLGVKLRPWSPEQARHVFLSRARALGLS